MKIAIIGGGPAGFMSAITAKEQNPNLDITIFDKGKPLSTLFVTGGGRCNLAYAEFDMKELASNFPRGEKFLYSVFSKFDTSSTFEFFEKNELELYVQDDNRIFPKSNKSSDVQHCLFSAARKHNIKINSNYEITSIKKNANFIINDKFYFDKVIIATGGKGKGFEFAKSLGHKITELAPSLYGMKTKEKWCTNISGLALQRANAKIENLELCDDLLFTHNGVSGPIILKASSYLAFNKKPLRMTLNIANKTIDEMDKELIEKLAQNSKKNIANILDTYAPSSFIEALLKENSIPQDKKAFDINSKERKIISGFLSELKITLIDIDKAPMVTAGGVSLDEVDNKTMQSKLVNGLYFCGEILNIDGLTGGFNLQACWSTGYIAGAKL